MACPLRVEFPGAVYHVMARGNERRLTFRDDEDRQRFLAALGEAVLHFGLRLHGYCLMPNHYHLLVETPRGNLSRALGWLQTTCTVRFNRRHRRSGHLFQGRFKAQLVEADSYSMELLRYLHLNPVRPRDKTALVPGEARASLDGYRWSSHRAYLGKQRAPEWLCTEWLSFFAGSRAEAIRRYARFMSDAFGAVAPNPWEGLQMGLVLGGKELLGQVKSLLGAKAKKEELRWVSRAEGVAPAGSAAVRLVAEERDRR